MVQNARYLGSPFWTFARHNAYHRRMVQGMVAELGTWRVRISALFFWPLRVLESLSPGVALLGAVGAVRAWRMSWARLVLVVTALPALYLTYRAAVRLDFALV